MTQDAITVLSVPQPVERAGLYIPGGLASYPSTVLMTALPARAAGVNEIVICTPPNPRGETDQAVLAAAYLCGVDELYKIGGVQAIGAMAYGTESMRAVDVIAGPGKHGDSFFVFIELDAPIATKGTDHLIAARFILRNLPWKRVGHVTENSQVGVQISCFATV